MNRRALAQARSESELFYLRARYYDPRTAQFISRDPAVSSTREPYAYAGDTPLDASDPSGMCWPSWACGAENWAGGQKDRLHGFVAAHASQIENVANVADTVSTVASFAEVGCAGAALAATAGILTIPA
ncbi:MAG TPA: RHS repeat-associated core domain-containing protein, partial [Candidatus Dormibacteraeota bacterium]|nr:RHS repeat-associated core domain-containing protein [Candidatus Dormibacteraeota bacterium]